MSSPIFTKNVTLNLVKSGYLKQGLVIGETSAGWGNFNSVKNPYLCHNKTVRLERLGARVTTLSVFGIPVLWYDPITFSVTRLRLPLPVEYSTELERRESIRTQFEERRTALLNQSQDPQNPVDFRTANTYRAVANSIPSISKINDPYRFIVFLIKRVGVDIRKAGKKCLVTTSKDRKVTLLQGQFINFPEKEVVIPHGYIVDTYNSERLFLHKTDEVFEVPSF